MKLSLDTNSADYVIRAYEQGRVVVNEQTITESVIVLPDRLITHWQPQTFDELHLEHLESLLELGPEIILLGTGARLRFLDAALMRHILARAIGLEVMDTAAACRTFNILSSEGRIVAAALMMI